MSINNMDKDLKHLIPTKTKVIIGIDNPKEYTIQPKLSFKKQAFDIPGLIEQIFADFYAYQKKAEKQQFDAIKSIFSSIKKHIMEILRIITGLDDKIVEDISNDQLIYIIDLIFKENYEESAKNAIALIARAKKTFTSHKS